MYFAFTACRQDYRVRENGTTLRIDKGRRPARAEEIHLTPTQRRIMSALVRADTPIEEDDLADLCLLAGQEESDGRIELLHRHVGGLRQALACPKLIRSRRVSNLKGSGSCFRLDAKVRRIDEAKDWEPMPPITEDSAAVVQPVLLDAQWFLPEARHSGTAMELHEIAVARPDSQVCLIGYEWGSFDVRSLPYFIAEFEPSGSSLLEWAGVVNSGNLEYRTVEVGGTREVLVVETRPDEQLRMVIGPTGARARLAWKSCPTAGAFVNMERRPASVSFTCGETAYSTLDGTKVYKHLSKGRKRTLELGPTPAKLLMLFLTRAATGILSNEEIWQEVWPEKPFTEESAKLIRQTIYRVRKGIESEEIILSAGPSGRYALNARLGLSLEGHPALPAGLAKMPARLVLPSGFVTGGPDARDAMTLHEVRARYPDGNIPTLGFAPDAEPRSLQWLLNGRSRSGRHHLASAGLDPSRPVACVALGDVCRVGDDRNHLLVFADNALTFEWTSHRDPAPGSAMAYLGKPESDYA